MLCPFMKNRLTTIWLATWLSQYKGVGCVKTTPKSCNWLHKQTILKVVDVITLYSTLVDEWETMACFSLFKKIRLFLRNSEPLSHKTTCPIRILISSE